MSSPGISALILLSRPLGRLVCVDSPFVRMGKTGGEAIVSTRVMVSTMFKADECRILSEI